MLRCGHYHLLLLGLVALVIVQMLRQRHSIRALHQRIQQEQDGKVPLPLVLIDGECVLCNGFAHFVMDHAGSRPCVQFAAQQSDVGRQALSAAGIESDLTTVFLLEGRRMFTHSEAVLRVMARLQAPFTLLHPLGMMVPSVVRDTIYRLIAANRITAFGTMQECRRSTPEYRAWFIDEPTEQRNPFYVV